MTNPTPHGQVPEALIDLIDAYAETRHRCGGIYNARTEAARKAVIEALSGVQALSAAPAVAAPAAPTPEHIAAMERAWLWMDNQADQQSKGGHATFDLMMLREERDALRAAIDAAPKATPVVWLSSKQLRGVTALHGQYLPFRCQPEGRFDTPVYLVEAAPKAAQEEMDKEASNARLDIDSNSTEPEQQRDVACSLEVGQHVGNGEHQEASCRGSKDSELLKIAARNLKYFIAHAQFSSFADKQAALNCIDILAAPQQEAQEPVIAYRISDPQEPTRGRWLSEFPGGPECVSEPLCLAKAASNTAGELLMGLAVIRELTGTQQKGLEDTIDAVRALLAARKAAPAPAILDELRDTLMAVSVAIAEQDDRAAQKMIREILAASSTPPAEQQAAQVIIDFSQVGTAGPFPVVNGRVSLPDSTMQDLVRMLRPTYEAEQQAAPNAAPVCVCGEPQTSGTTHRVDGPCYAAAPQQEPAFVDVSLRTAIAKAVYQQVPAFVDVSLRTAIAKAVYQQVRVEFDYKLGSWTALDADEQQRIVDSIRGLYTAPQPAPAPLSEMPYEKRKAIQEGEQISASDAWFHARLNMLDTLDRRNVFRAGFDRGWNAALAAQGGK